MKYALIYSLDKHPKSCNSCRMNGQADHSFSGKGRKYHLETCLNFFQKGLPAIQGRNELKNTSSGKYRQDEHDGIF